jgi:hypothetical protein
LAPDSGGSSRSNDDVKLIHFTQTPNLSLMDAMDLDTTEQTRMLLPSRTLSTHSTEKKEKPEP